MEWDDVVPCNALQTDVSCIAILRRTPIGCLGLPMKWLFLGQFEQLCKF